MSTKSKVAVYGSLRKGLHNHSVIANAKFLGDFQTTPMFDMYSLGSFPGLKQHGSTSVLMEVYEVDADTLDRVNSLEGYVVGRDDNDFYDRIKLTTPYGDAYSYIYVPEVNEQYLVESGDWKEYYDTSKIN